MDEYKRRQAQAREWSRKARKADTSVKHGMRAEMKEEKDKANTAAPAEERARKISLDNGDLEIALEREQEFVAAVERYVGQKLIEPVVTASSWTYASVVEGRIIIGPVYDQKYGKVAFRVSEEEPNVWKIVDLSN